VSVDRGLLTRITWVYIWPNTRCHYH